jgi:hypothetical protein
MKKFLKTDGLQLINGGYLSTKEDSPVTNDAFVTAQRRAEYVVTFAAMAKGKTFVAKKVDSLDVLKAEVAKALSAKKTSFVSTPKKPTQKTTEVLAKEAMAFLDYGKDLSKAEKINTFLQEFTVLQEFEEFGLFFDEGIVKLNKIYTVADVVKAVEATIALLD